MAYNDLQLRLYDQNGRMSDAPVQGMTFAPDGTLLTAVAIENGNGDVVGPDEALDGHLVVFDGVTGKLVKDGGAAPTASGDVVGPALVTSGAAVVFDGTTGKLIKQTTVKIYRALLSQSGTDAPVATVLENTFGGTVVWNYVTNGQYSGILTGAFPVELKVIPFIGPGRNGNEIYFVGFQWVDANTIKIFSGDGADNSDDILIKRSLEILVYP